ncbi:hypothetical protein [Dactylosporangium roseum]|nr:hypothetical protein [Dactylosporangium roseum]
MIALLTALILTAVAAHDRLPAWAMTALAGAAFLTGLATSTGLR